MHQNGEQEAIGRVEAKLDELTRMINIQSGAILVIAVVLLLPLLPLALVIILAAIPFLVYFRRQIPRWSRSCGRFLGMLVPGRTSSESSSR